MPLIMDGGLSVDDLFGDPTSIDLAINSRQPTKGLAQRLEELRLSGCCQKIAWSRLGCIAYISHDGLQVVVRHLICSPADGKWSLSEEYPQHHIVQHHLGQRLLHLCWNEIGSDLAVLDASGRVSILTINAALNNLAVSRQAITDPSDDGAQVVGMMWLNSNRAVHAFHQAAKVNGRWNYSPFRRKPIGPFHPAGKPALLCFTKNGMMRLLYQNPDQRWAEISAELASTNQSDRILTHATCLPSPNGILVATHSLSEKLSLYRVQIMWNPGQWDPTQQRQGPAAIQFPEPSIRVTHCKTEILERTFNFPKDVTDGSQEKAFNQNFLYQLTNLELVSGQAENVGTGTSATWIIAIFSRPCNGTDVELQEARGPPAAVMVKWQLETSILSLHPVFEEVITKKSHVQQKTKLEIRRTEDVYFDKHVISIDHIEFGTVLAFTHDDGSISLFDPRSLSTLHSDGDLNTVTSLGQAGFRFPFDVSGPYTCFSPNGCLAVTLDTDGQAQLRIAAYNFESGGDLQEGTNSIGIVALSLAFCRGCAIEHNTDDLLLTITRQLSTDAQTVFISEVYRALPINCNFSMEQDKSMHHPYVPRCLSFQAALGMKAFQAPRNLPSSVPWAILHLRHAYLLLSFFYSWSRALKENDAPDHDVLQVVYGNTKWAIDFTQYLMDDLFALAKELEPFLDDSEALTQKLKTKASLSLILILASMSRAFLNLVCRGLRGIHASCNTFPFAGDGRAYSKELLALIDNAPIRFNVYEKFLHDVESSIKNAYQAAGHGDNERRTPEKDLLLNSRIPAVMTPVVVNLFKKIIPAVQKEVDQMAVYLADYSWLGFCSDRRTEQYRLMHRIDIIKKMPLRGVQSRKSNGTTKQGLMVEANGNENKSAPSLRRRCVRCGEFTGDPPSPRSTLYFQLTLRMQLIRNCLCTGMWTFEEGPPLLGGGPGLSTHMLRNG